MRLYTDNIDDYMAVQVREQVEQKVQFREVAGNSKLNLHIANHEADHAGSMKALADNGLRPLTYQEAFTRSSELITELKGKWFYLDGQGTDKSGIYTYNNKGELTELTGGETIDQKVRVWSGNQPLSIFVYSVPYARIDGRRFFLFAYYAPNVVAPVVVGVKLQAEPSQAQAGVLEVANASKQLQKAVQNVARSVGPAEEVVSRIEESGLMRSADVKKLKALVRDATAITQLS
jgi:hypothetical protein